MKTIYLFFSLFLLSHAVSLAEATRPNFLLIIADDLCRRDLGYEGNTEVKTPNLDELCTESMHLRRMFNPATTCSPTRHALYTGLYPIRSGAFPNHTRVYDGTKSLFTHLKEAGYRVALQNKQHVGPPASFPYEHIEGADDLTDTIQPNLPSPPTYTTIPKRGVNLPNTTARLVNWTNKSVRS